MKKILIILLLLGGSFRANAQAWDWRTPNWEIYTITNVLGVGNSFPSPFSSQNNPNTQSLPQPPNPQTGLDDTDWQPEDGWVLLKKDLGTDDAHRTNQPYVLLYNKHTAVVRAFFLVVQQFSANTSGSTNTTDATITITFIKLGTAYQPNLLVNSAPLQPLDVFVDKNQTTIPNYARNLIPYWLFADIPVSYDPCTSIADNPGYLNIQTTLLVGANLNFTLQAQPYETTIDNSKVKGDFSTGVREVLSGADKVLSGGIKYGKKFEEVFEKFEKATDKHSDLVRKTKLKEDLKKLSEGFGKAAKWASLVPAYGEAASSVLSLIDMFAGGGSEKDKPEVQLFLMILKVQVVLLRLFRRQM